MLKFLHIENVAVIEQADIEFTEGFNVLTGETGAGKSIVIDAINAVLGERTSKELIRAGCNTATVSAVFGFLDSECIAMLESNGFSTDEDGNIIITRRLSLNGKGLIKLNDRPITATELKGIGRHLISIHGQHDNQALLDPEKHLDYIDALVDDDAVKGKYYAEFRELNRIRRELASVETDRDEKQRNTELLTYQINELEAAEIKNGEYAELKKKLNIALAYQKTYEALSSAFSALSGTDDTAGAKELVTLAQKSVSGLKNSAWDALVERLKTANSLLCDVASELSDFIFNTEYSQMDEETINSRLAELDKLMAKYGGSEDACLEFLDKAREELAGIKLSDERANELSDLLDSSTERLVALGDELTASRRKTADAFGQAVSEVLAYLNMQGVEFCVSMQKGRYTKNGCDTAEFMLSANKGESVKPLCKTASGGELSRVMLAIKSVLLDKDKVQTMIFDEIDTGISGYTAGKVGTQLKKVSINRQVICVTHLAQIAAMADNHLLIEKNASNGRTYTSVELLSYEERIKEIARIMSGADITENLYNSAKELLDRSK